jgi:RNA polymerase sigma-70 factor (ECF subfamily)
MQPLRERFAAVLPQAALPTDLEASLAALLTFARQAWPGVDVDDAAFVEHLASKIGDAPVTRALASMHASDLFLALACGSGHKTALDRFEAAYGRELPAALSRMRADRATVDEVGQAVRSKLFVGPQKKILEYSGRGALRGWLRAVIVRTAIDLRRHELLEPRVTRDGQVGEAGAAPSDEQDLIRRRYAGPLKSAFEDALRALPLEDRTVLRMYILDGLNIDEIGRLNGVHRATIARWIKRAREDLLVAARRLLRERLDVDSGEFDSLARACRSQLEVSVRGILGG